MNCYSDTNTMSLNEQKKSCNIHTDEVRYPRRSGNLTYIPVYLTSSGLKEMSFYILVLAVQNRDLVELFLSESGTTPTSRDLGGSDDLHSSAVHKDLVYKRIGE